MLGSYEASKVLLAGQPVGWFAPTYKILADAWRELKADLAAATVDKSEQEKRLELITGGTLECWSLDSGAAGRSRKYALAIIDEAALVPDLETIYYEAIRPTLTDLSGRLLILSTPKGMNFFWRMFQRGQDPLQSEYESWQMPSASNPYLPEGEVDAAQAEMPERAFRQEYLAEFLADAGGVFLGVEACIATEPFKPQGPFSMGVDLARKEDFTVLTVLDAFGRQCYFERFNQISWERQIAAIARVAAAFAGVTIWIDATGLGDPIFEVLRTRGMNVQPYMFTASSKESLMENLAMLIEGQRVQLMNEPVQTSELQAFQYELTRTGRVRMSAPAGFHDDTVCALALAAWPLCPSGDWSTDPGVLKGIATGQWRA